jgi:hypothetical protein
VDVNVNVAGGHSHERIRFRMPSSPPIRSVLPIFSYTRSASCITYPVCNIHKHSTTLVEIGLLQPMTQKSMLVIESCTNSSSSSICASVTASAVRFVLPSSSSSVLSAGGLCFAMNCNVRGMTSAPQEPDRNTQLPLSNVYFCEKCCFAKRHNSLTITNRRQIKCRATLREKERLVVCT